jgi:hypothetical protein
MKNLSRFQSATRNKTFESQDPYRVIRATQLVKEEMRKHLKRMAGGRYFEESLTALQEMLQEQEAAQTDTIKNYFVQQYYNESLDAWLGSAAMAYKRCEDNNMNLNQDIPLTEDDDDDVASFKDQTEKRAANPAKIGSSVELYANPHTDAEMRKLLKSQPLRGMISLILSDIASRAVDDETAILASKADSGEFTVSHKKMIEAYLKDLFSDNPPRKGESERRTINYPGKRKKPEDEFESAIMNIGEEPAEEEMDEGTRAMGVAGRVWADKARHLGQLDRSSKKSYRAKDQPSKADQQGELDALTKEFMARGGKVSRSMREEVPNLAEQGCNHTMEGEHCPVHGMNECGSMYEEIAELRRLSGLGECWDGMMMGDQHDTAGTAHHSAEMSRAKRLEQAIADKANADAEAQTNWVIDQIRSQPTWTAPDLEEPKQQAEEVGFNMSSDHPHADQKQPEANQEQEVDEVILGPNDQPDMTDVAVARFGQGLRKELNKESDEEMDEVSEPGRDPRNRFRSLKKAHNKLGEEGDDSHEHKPDQDGDGVPDWADKKPGRDDQENKPEMEEAREFYEAMREMRRLSGLSEQTSSWNSTAQSDPNNPIDQTVATMRAMSPSQRNAMTDRNSISLLRKLAGL